MVDSSWLSGLGHPQSAGNLVRVQFNEVFRTPSTVPFEKFEDWHRAYLLWNEMIHGPETWHGLTLRGEGWTMLNLMVGICRHSPKMSQIHSHAMAQKKLCYQPKQRCLKPLSAIYRLSSATSSPSYCKLSEVSVSYVFFFKGVTLEFVCKVMQNQGHAVDAGNPLRTRESSMTRTTMPPPQLGIGQSQKWDVSADSCWWLLDKNQILSISFIQFRTTFPTFYSLNEHRTHTCSGIWSGSPHLSGANVDPGQLARVARPLGREEQPQPRDHGRHRGPGRLPFEGCSVDGRFLSSWAEVIHDPRRLRISVLNEKSREILGVKGVEGIEVGFM